MFLFLSKLLPLLIYPLGFSIVLLSLALWFLRKRPRLARGAILLSMLILWLSSTSLLSRSLVGSLERQHLPQDLPQADAIVLLGGATRSANAPRPWVDLSEEGDRVVHTARLYRQGKAAKVILSGGRVKWNGAGQPESQDMAELLEFFGVPMAAMLQDPTSLNTYQNAVNVKAILVQQQLRRVLLVTSAMHMPRSLLIFRKLGIEAIPAPTDFWVADADNAMTAEGRLLSLLPDGENLRMTNRALKEYIGLWIYRLRGWA